MLEKQPETTPEGARSGARSGRTIALLAVLAILGWVVYSPGIGIPHYLDDFELVFRDPGNKPIFYYFLHSPPLNGYYRPIQNTLLLATQSRFGPDTSPVQITQITLHILLSWAIAISMLRVGFPRAHAGLGAMYFLVSQAGVMAVLSNDTLSQVGGTSFGYLGLCLAGSALLGPGDSGAGHAPRRVPLLAGLLAFLIALLFKESSLAFLPMLLLVLASARTPGGSPTRRWILPLLPFVLVALFYLLIRSSVATVHPSFGPDGSFHVGLNVPENLLMLALVALLPVSSVDVYLGVREGDPGFVVAAMLLTISVVLAVSWGARREWKHRRALVLATAFAGLAVFPMVLMHHVSELYVYNALPFVAVAVGAGLGHFVSWAQAVKRRAPALALPAILLLSHAMATASKASLMRDSGEKASHVLHELGEHFRRAPRGGVVVLVNPEGLGPEYSVFLWDGFHGVAKAEHVLRERAGRPDVNLVLVDEPEVAGRLLGDPSTVVLGISGRDVTTFRR